MEYVFGGCKEYNGLDLAKAHAHLIKRKGLGLNHFDLVAGHFVAALTELGVEEGLVQEAAAVVLTTRPIFDPAQYQAAAVVPAPTDAAAASATSAVVPAEKPSLAERLGGETALVAAVDLFYVKLLKDPELVRFFDNVPMKLQKQKQASPRYADQNVVYIRYTSQCCVTLGGQTKSYPRDMTHTVWLMVGSTHTGSHS